MTLFTDTYNLPISQKLRCNVTCSMNNNNYYYSDSNPNVTAGVTREVCLRNRIRAAELIKKYVKEIDENKVFGPSSSPTLQPSTQPLSAPSLTPSRQPSSPPSTLPTSSPTSEPSLLPSSLPSSQPSVLPTSQQSIYPTIRPSMSPSAVPSLSPLLFVDGMKVRSNDTTDEA